MKGIGFLFDLDGVLIDSETEYTRIWTQIEAEYPTGQDNFALKIKGQTLTKILKDNYPEEIRASVSRRLHDLEQKMQYRYCKGASEFLKELNIRGCKLAVVTSSDEVKMAHLYADLPKFKESVHVIIDASKVKRSKPDPEGYLLGARELDVRIEKSVVFEDSVQGVMAGRSAGAYVVGITGTKSAEELAPFSHIVVDSFEGIEIDKLIETLKKR